MLESLSPNVHIARLHADVFIIHDINDPDIPYVESLKLVKVIQGKLEEHLLLTEIFHHVNPVLPSNLCDATSEIAKFYFFLYQNLSELQ